jgi:hypothetical protein
MPAWWNDTHWLVRAALVAVLCAVLSLAIFPLVESAVEQGDREARVFHP